MAQTKLGGVVGAVADAAPRKQRGELWTVVSVALSEFPIDGGARRETTGITRHGTGYIGILQCEGFVPLEAGKQVIHGLRCRDVRYAGRVAGAAKNLAGCRARRGGKEILPIGAYQTGSNRRNVRSGVVLFG